MSSNRSTYQICSKSICSIYRSTGCKVREVMLLIPIIIFLFATTVKVTYNSPNLIILVPGFKVYRSSMMVAFFISIVLDRTSLEAVIFSVCIIANYCIGSHGI